MEASFVEVKEIVDELPIGYYAKRRIKLTLGKEAEASYYNPVEDEIVISYPQITSTLSTATAVEKDDYRETAIRSVVYHEVSHAMMTPKTLREYVPYGCFDIVNVFEDERMETILKNFYRGVNFKKNILYLCGGKITPPKNAFEAFFNLVRFRAYKDASLLDEVDRIIKDYPNLFDKNRDAEYWYVDRVVDLYKRVFKDWKDNKGSSSNLSDEERKNLENQINQEGNGAGYSQNDKNENEDKNASPNKGQGEENGEKGEESKEKGTPNEEKGNPPEGETEKNGEGGQNTNPFEAICSKFHDTKATEMFKSIIETFNKKNSSGNGCHGYSGIFNPRNFKNEDYKFFDRKISTRGNNRFGKFHLNLFVDESGSFCHLQDAANAVICSLAEVEKQNPNFSFDLICDSYGFRETEKKHRMIKANGGNGITYKQVVDVMKKHTAKDSYVYNIVLHDGSICFHSWNGEKNPFLGWDRNNVTIIDTGDNRHLISQCNNARTVYSPYSKLVENLANEVANALKVAFR